MDDKLKILEITSRKISSDRDFMSFVLNKYIELEKKSEQDLIDVLKCSMEDYYKLSLCKVPNSTSIDFIDKLNNISEYTHASIIELNKIIKRVDAIIHLPLSENNSSYLMAARDKKNDKKD